MYISCNDYINMYQTDGSVCSIKYIINFVNEIILLASYSYIAKYYLTVILSQNYVFYLTIFFPDHNIKIY